MCSMIRVTNHVGFVLSFVKLPSDPCIIETLKHKCFLEELLFWTIKYEFPQKMVTFLLNMLPDQDYKVFFPSLVNISKFFSPFLS